MDVLSYRASRDERRAIAWDAPVEPLDDRRRVLVGDAWRSRMESEHLAVGAFSILAAEIARLGCDPMVLALVTRAASDEVRHTEICRRLAVRHLGDEVPARFAGAPGFPERAPGDAAEQVLHHVVEMCCLNETFTVSYFTAMLERTRQATAKTAVQALLEDEIDHARAGWAYLADVRRGGGGGSLAAALPALLTATVKPVMDDAVTHPQDDDPELEAHAWLGTKAARAIYAKALGEVVLPGFEACGVDTAAARALCTAEGWL
jgi:hypothetical protein